MLTRPGRLTSDAADGGLRSGHESAFAGLLRIPQPREEGSFAEVLKRFGAQAKPEDRPTPE